MPVLLCQFEQNSNGILTQRFAAGNDGAGCGKRSASPVSDVHQIDDMGHRLVVENSHTYNQPDHGFEGKLTLT